VAIRGDLSTEAPHETPKVRLPVMIATHDHQQAF
jgi:hypothetical protein